MEGHHGPLPEPDGTWCAFHHVASGSTNIRACITNKQTPWLLSKPKNIAFQPCCLLAKLNNDLNASRETTAKLNPKTRVAEGSGHGHKFMFTSKVCVIRHDGLCEGFRKKVCVGTFAELQAWTDLVYFSPRTPLWRDVINQETAWRSLKVWVYRSLQAPLPTDERNLKLVVTQPLWLTSDSEGGDWTLQDVAASLRFKVLHLHSFLSWCHEKYKIWKH